MKKILLITAITFAVIVLLIYLSNGVVNELLLALASPLHIIAPVAASLSFGLLWYVDGITKDLSQQRDSFDAEPYEKALSDLAALKREIFSTAIFILILFGVEYGVDKITPVILKLVESKYIEWTAITVRITCLSLTAFAIIEQFRGFSTALNFGEITSHKRQS